MFGGGMASGSSKGLKLPLTETLKGAWADPDLRARILFVFAMFGVFVAGVFIPVPIPGVSSEAVAEMVSKNPFFAMIDVFGGGAIRRLSIFALGLNPYITASIIIQILTQAFPEWKKELQEGGEYARKAQNRRTRFLTLILCIAQSQGFIQIIRQSGVVMGPFEVFTTTVFWTAGAMFVLWIGEQISEKGIGNGVSLMIFAGIMISLPFQVSQISQELRDGILNYFQVGILILLFFLTTWFVVFFTIAQRRIPVQTMRRNVGTKAMGGQTSFLPIPVNTAGVIPIIFAVSLVLIPSQFASFFPATSEPHRILTEVGKYLYPGTPGLPGIVGALVYTVLIFFFTYFYTAIQYNVEDIANNLKRSQAFIQGVRPGKQTRDFLDSVISRITIAGAFFLTVVALMQYAIPALVQVPPSSIRLIGGTSLLIMVSVALDTMRQIEANILMRQYNN